MSIWTLFRRNALPVAPEQDALYFVADPNDATLCDAFVSGGLGNVRKVSTSRRFDFVQASPAAVWTINHNLGRPVAAAVYSVGGMELEADVVNISANQTQVLFVSPTAGSAVIT